MRSLFLIVNTVCNINCTYCFYTTHYQRRFFSRIQKNKITNFVSKITELKFNEVILTGGEPLHRRWKEETYALIRELKKRKIKVLINTSATFLNNADLDKIIGLKVDRVDISIDSHISKIHNSQRGRFKDIVAVIKGLISRGYRSISTTTVVTKNNARTLLETILWIRKLGVENVRIQRAFLPTKKEEVLNNRKKIQENDIVKAMRVAKKELNSSHFGAYINLTEAVFKKDTKLLNSLASDAFCCMGKKYFVCDPAGDLTPCFHRSDIKLGNLFTDSISKINSMLRNNALTDEEKLPKCFDAYCVSLFNNPNFWKKKYE